MANQHRHRQRVIRGIPDEEVAALDSAAARAGSDRSAITRALWAWYARLPGAELPERPPAPTES
ncbi:hypothetical protein SAMN05216251_108239 [Actinacidiphila alni]|uniref:Uncharacterized protein n=1 Tax=Actinacidiphila alni TaxID=380248 RepID=A0A1I2G453_9ACTN|nr:hypothetical protein [Actinacidiphila alni]SFF11893.1 hypothetical protein SAMN05216251_108239 [Actinacidiphila alni]